MLDEAEVYVIRIPTDETGRMFLYERKAVQPDLDRWVEDIGNKPSEAETAK